MESGANNIIMDYEKSKEISNDLAINLKLQEFKTKMRRNGKCVDKFEENNETNEEIGKISDQPNMRACRALKECFDFVEMFGWPIGFKVNYEWRGSPKYFFSVAYLTFTWSQFWYSQYSYFNNAEYKRIFEVFAVYGVAVSCVLKVICFKRYFKEMKAIFDFNVKICQLSVGNQAEKLENRQIKNLKLYKIISFSMSLSALIYVIYPIKAFVFEQELTSLLPIDIIFTDQSTLSGFLIANTFMLAMGLLALIGIIYFILHLVSAVLNYTSLVDMIEMDINELDQCWRDETTTSMPISLRHKFLRNICQKCQDKNSYMTEVKKIYDQNIFFYFCAAYLSQILCLYEIKAENWMSGYGIAFGLFLEMMLYCIVGTRTTIENERLCYVLNQSNWYTYDIYSQKMVLFLINSSMNTKELSIGPLAPLSVFTGTEIIKSIYTYYTILAEVM